jgi:hypothetical protein
MSVMSRILEKYMYVVFDDSYKKEISLELQRNCPGKYTLDISEITAGLSVIIHFDDPSEATVFRLKEWI